MKARVPLYLCSFGTSSFFEKVVIARSVVMFRC